MENLNKVSIRLIDKNTDISSLTMTKYEWDLVINQVPYQVVRIDGYIHTIGGSMGINDLWCYPRNSEPSYNNLRQYNCDEPVTWGIVYEPNQYLDYRYDNGEIKTGYKVYITRNGEKFCKVDGKGIQYAIDKARICIARLNEHPINFNSYLWEDQITNRKIYFRGQPGIITDFHKGEGSFVIYPDFPDGEINRFKKPAEWVHDGDSDYYDDEYVVTSIFDSNIWWWRE